ncbi:MAG: hypothetical protein WC757_03495 [Candidatus Paceibacterota bacterium]|jgi:cell division protein FtsB
MDEYKNKKRTKRFIYSIPAILVLVLLCGLLVRATWGMYIRASQSEEEAFKASSELFDLKQREVSLRNSIERLKTDSGIEAEIREKYNVAREGEHVVVLTGGTGTVATTTPKSMWEKTRQSFSKMFKW